MGNELYDEICKLVEHQTVKFRKLLEREILEIVKSQMNQLEKRIIEVMPKLVGLDEGEMYVELPVGPNYEPEVKEVLDDDEQYDEIRNLEKLVDVLEDDNPIKKGIMDKINRKRRERDEAEKIIERKLKKKKKKKKKKKRRLK